MQPLRLSAVLLFAAFAAACGSAGPPEAYSDAGRLRKELGDAFASDARFAERVEVSVSASRGVVTLEGEVATAGDIEEAAKLASSVRGVAVLYNLLEVEKIALPAARATRAEKAKPGEIVAGTR